MLIRTLLAMAVLGCAPLMTAPAEKVRNERVVVALSSLGPGEEEPVAPERNPLAVFLADGSVEIAAGSEARKLEVRRGDVHSVAGGRRIRNTGAAPLRYVRVDFLGPGNPETWGTRGLSPNYKLLLENRYLRAYDIRIPAHTVEPRHTHEDRVVICLSGARLSHLLPDGRDEPSTLQTGEIAWRRGGTHTGRNLGETDLWVIAVEPK